jgi:flagellar basal-body rod modification protein FlgD
MQILGTSALTNALQPLATNSSGTNGTSSTNSSSSASATSSLTSEATFLKLLIAQIQNQDPLNPTDSIQFVGQLVQYSELEQLMGINQGVQSLDGAVSPTSTSGSSPSASTKTPSST